MNAKKRPIGFVIAATQHGSMILNRFDHYQSDVGQWGVGFELLRDGAFSANEVSLCLALLAKRREHFGDGVFALDGGANIGVHSVEWAKAMDGWGKVLAVEAQERIFYALCGNLAINNCFNAKALHAALGETEGQIPVPTLDYLSHASFGSLELKKRSMNEPVGQPVSYTDLNTNMVRLLHIDGMSLDRLDFLKLDVEGMEEEVLRGASASIGQHRPILLVERIKSNGQALEAFFAHHGYRSFMTGMNYLAIHPSDPSLASIRKS